MSKWKQTQRRLPEKLFGALNRGCVADEPAYTPAAAQKDIARPFLTEYRRRRSSLLSLATFLQNDCRESSFATTGQPPERRTKKRVDTRSRRRPSSVPLVQVKGRASPVRNRRASIGDRVQPIECCHATKEQVRQATLDALNGNIEPVQSPPWSFKAVSTVMEPALPVERRQPMSEDRSWSRHKKRESTTSDGRGRSLTRKADVDNLRESARRHRDESEIDQRRTSERRNARARNHRIRRSSLSKPLPRTPNMLNSNLDWPLRTESSLEVIHRLGGSFMRPNGQEDVVNKSEPSIHDHNLRGSTQPSIGTLPKRLQRREAADRQSSDLIQSLQNDGFLDLNNSEETHSAVLWSPAVTHATNIVKPIEVVQPVVCREIYNHHFSPRVLPIIDMQVLPARHFIPADGGGYLEITEDEIPGGKPTNLHQVIANAVLEHNPMRQMERLSPISTDGTIEENRIREPWSDTNPAIHTKYFGMHFAEDEPSNTILAQHGDGTRNADASRSWTSVMSQPTESASEVVEKQDGVKESQHTEIRPSTSSMIHTIFPIRLEYDASTEAESTSSPKERSDGTGAVQ